MFSIGKPWESSISTIYIMKNISSNYLFVSCELDVNGEIQIDGISPLMALYGLYTYIDI